MSSATLFSTPPFRWLKHKTLLISVERDNGNNWEVRARRFGIVGPMLTAVKCLPQYPPNNMFCLPFPWPLFCSFGLTRVLFVVVPAPCDVWSINPDACGGTGWDGMGCTHRRLGCTASSTAKRATSSALRGPSTASRAITVWTGKMLMFRVTGLVSFGPGNVFSIEST